MSKAYHEIASDIVQAVVKARGEALNTNPDSGAYAETFLSDEAVVNTYKAIFNAVTGK
ncbi:hypothetical protein MHB85_19270 [Paenibacillus sp. FSL K6-4396]|uniref:hypothetical protein n=1 Tax=Paenibacillus sp. FSL K6-4396 TaxID=2921506 RepID=UPI0030FBA1B8